MGGTGDPPVPSGDSPLGMGGRNKLFRTRTFLGTPAVIPSGQWPDGTGQWPVPPALTSAFGLNPTRGLVGAVDEEEARRLTCGGYASEKLVRNFPPFAMKG